MLYKCLFIYLFIYLFISNYLQVIGLDRQGYGRILAECMFTAKIMYCLWVTLAEKDDNFVIETTKPLPKKYKNMSRKEQMEFIKERILGKSNEELIQVSACVRPKIHIKRNVLRGYSPQKLCTKI